MQATSGQRTASQWPERPAREVVRTVPDGPPPGERMSGHTDRSGSTVHGWAAAAFGTPFLLIGTLISTLAALGRIEPSGDTPHWVAVACGGIFAIPGAWLIVHGIRGVARDRRTARQRAANPREPWAWDHAWSPIGSADDASRTLGALVAFVLFASLLLVPFNWVSFFSRERPLVFQVVTGTFDVIIVALIGWGCYLAARRAKYGVTTLRFRRFPFLVGDEVEVMLPREGPIATLARVEATLRCVQERFETTRRGTKRESRVVSYAVWSETRAPEAGDGRPSSARELVWRFRVPAGLPGTALSERPPRYWELEVRGEAPGVDYRGVFLVPVYADARERRERRAS